MCVTMMKKVSSGGSYFPFAHVCARVMYFVML